MDNSKRLARIVGHDKLQARFSRWFKAKHQHQPQPPTASVQPWPNPELDAALQKNWQHGLYSIVAHFDGEKPKVMATAKDATEAQHKLASITSAHNAGNNLPAFWISPKIYDDADYASDTEYDYWRMQ